MKRLTWAERERREGRDPDDLLHSCGGGGVPGPGPVVVRPQQSLLSRMCFVFINRAASAERERERERGERLSFLNG